MMPHDKNHIRDRARAARQGLPAQERDLLSRLACKRVLAVSAVASLHAGSLVLGYAASAEELDPATALDALRARGVRVLLPRISGPESLTLHECAHDELEPGPYGISQPCASAPALGSGHVSVVIVPGVAFDAHGHRLGYGGGYYDRLLANMRAATFVGLAFDGQLAEKIPAEPHDVRVRWVVTPTRTFETR